ncbi:MAG: hypothetical protein KUG77_23860 [Nannocystaceae bacterium]|nr:hypothetical protein [Nannocystaceae bacterium]
MAHLARAAVRVLLVLTGLMGVLTLVSGILQAFALAGSATSATVALGLMPLATWMGWRTAVSSAEFMRWLVRGTVSLAVISALASLVGLSWPVVMAVVTGTAVVDFAPLQGVAEVGGAGICISAVLLGVIAVAVLWDEPPETR